MCTYECADSTVVTCLSAMQLAPQRIRSSGKYPKRCTPCYEQQGNWMSGGWYSFSWFLLHRLLNTWRSTGKYCLRKLVPMCFQARIQTTPQTLNPKPKPNKTLNPETASPLDSLDPCFRIPTTLNRKSSTLQRLTPNSYKLHHKHISQVLAIVAVGVISIGMYSKAWPLRPETLALNLKSGTLNPEPSSLNPEP